ncbi:MAG: hypothetical protein M1826_002478 [Phylliscum demangeonii]|nr:MAG: hypothetical protein M1826_002478 [Phylliscum demangeonii]
MARSSSSPPLRSPSYASPSRALHPPKPRLVTRSRYLLLYNSFSLLLWSTILLRVLFLILYLLLLSPPTTTTTVWRSLAHTHALVGPLVRRTQTLAVLELAHSAAGLVRAPVRTTAIQIASRLLLVWAVVEVRASASASTTEAEETTVGDHPVYASMLLAWSVTEVVRYAYFVAMLWPAGTTDSRGGGAWGWGWGGGWGWPALRWLRYHTFLVLYPVGIASEAFLIGRAVAPLLERGPVAWAWAWVLRAVLVAYVPGSYIMYTHMIAQRRRMMRGKQPDRIRI